MSSYRQIFRAAWNVIWQSPAVWFLGFFVMMLGNVGELELLISGYSFGRQNVLFAFWNGIFGSGLLSPAGIQNAFSVISSNFVIFFVFILLSLLVLAISVLLIWMSIVSQSALIAKAVASSRGQELQWKKAFSRGLEKFWPILGINVLLRLTVWLLFIFLGVVALLDFTGSLVVFVVAFDVLLLGVVITSFMSKLAISGIVLKDWSVKESILKSKELFVNNWLLCLEISMVLFLIYAFVNSLLVYFLTIGIYYAVQIYTVILSPLVLIGAILLLIFIAVQTAVTIFHWATWAIVFDALTNQQSFLRSWLNRLFSRK